MDFGQALQELKNGHKVARAGWNGKGMFVYLVRGARISQGNLRNEAAQAFKSVTNDSDSLVTINPHIDMKAADGSIVVGWLASQTDMLANDWEVVN